MPLPRSSRPSGTNREAWLTELARRIQPLYRGFHVVDYRLTCGWPSKMALSRKVRRYGECHSDKSSTGGVHEIFITPLLELPLEVGGVVCHELAHVAAGIAAGHKGLFVKVCKQVGLTKGKPIQAMPGPALEEKIAHIVEKLGPYPHKAMSPLLRTVIKEKREFTVICSQCGCSIRMSSRWIEDAGFPTCACGTEMELKQ